MQSPVIVRSDDLAIWLGEESLAAQLLKLEENLLGLLLLDLLQRIFLLRRARQVLRLDRQIYLLASLLGHVRARATVDDCPCFLT